MKLAKNFTLSELSCRCGCATPPEVLTHLYVLAFCLQRIRDYYQQPVYVNSGYRCISHNAKVGGASRSFHLQGFAVDIRVQGVLPAQVFKDLQKLIAIGYILAGGLKCYGSFVHYDIRGKLTKF